MKLSNSTFWKNIKQKIEIFHLRFLLEVIGKEYLSNKELNLLESFFGKEYLESKKDEISLLDKIYMFGNLKSKLGENAKNVSYKDYIKFLEKEEYLKYNKKVEKEKLDNLKKQAYLDVLSKGFKIEKDIKQNILNKEQNNEKIKKDTIKEISQFIIEKFEDWTEDIDSSISYISQSALNKGIADQIEEDTLEEDPLVYFIVHPNACNSCKRLYLEKDYSPKVFKLSELRSNGSNIGLKVQSWKPTLNSLHINCRCQLEYLPNNYIWNKEYKRFLPKEKENKIERKSKVKLIIGDKVYEV